MSKHCLLLLCQTDSSAAFLLVPFADFAAVMWIGTQCCVTRGNECCVTIPVTAFKRRLAFVVNLIDWLYPVALCATRKDCKMKCATLHIEQKVKIPTRERFTSLLCRIALRRIEQGTSQFSP